MLPISGLAKTDGIRDPGKITGFGIPGLQSLVYLHPFRRNLLLNVRHSRRSQKSIKSFFGVQGSSKSWMFKGPKSSTLVLVVIDSMPVCNRFHGRLANSSKITTFTGYRSLMPSCAGFLECRKSILGSLKSILNAKSFICSLSLSVSIDFGAIRS